MNTKVFVCAFKEASGEDVQLPIAFDDEGYLSVRYTCMEQDQAKN